jgi:dTDP-4-amino-4,6-dideoxygalactose transaminase
MAAGATPRLVDVSPSTCDFSPDALSRALDDRAAAVVVVDAFGMPSDVGTVETLAGEVGCAVVEDACQAYGGVVDGVPLGARGRAGVVSFGYAKPLELGGGGAILTSDGRLAGRIEEIVDSRSYARFARLKNRWALKLMMNDDYAGMVARDRRMALLRYRFPAPQLRRLGRRFDRWVDEVARVRANVDRIRAALGALPGVVPFEAGRGAAPLFWRYSVRVPERSLRDSLVERLSAAGVRTTRLYRPVTDFLDVECDGDVPGARELSEQIVNVAYRTTTDDTARVADSLERVAGEAG